MLRIARKLVLLLATALCVLLAAVMLGPALAGYDRYVIVSGSMTGSYDRGSVVLAKPVPVADLRVGDVITYAPPPGSTPMSLVTHRIASIGRGTDGERVFRTKGDANRSVDPWKFTLSNRVQPRVSAGVPYVGFVIAALADRRVRMGVIGVPALLIAIGVLAGLVRDARRHSRPPVPEPAWTRL